MNTNFLSIVKRIVSEQDESIFADPRRLKGWISDYAKDEPKAERLAFGRCIEYGAYTELKNAPPGGRAAVKNRLAQRLHSEEGLDMILCAGSLDLLEAALFGAPDPSTAGDEWATVAEQKAAGQAKPPEPPPVFPPQPENVPVRKRGKAPIVLVISAVVVGLIVIWYLSSRSSVTVQPVPEPTAPPPPARVLPMTFIGHSNTVNSVAWSPDGRRIVSGSWDDTVKIWDAENGQEIRTLTGHDDWIDSVAWSPDGQRVVSGSDDNTVRIWDAESGQEIRTLKGHTDGVRTVAYSPDGRRIVSGLRDSTIKIWDAESGREIKTLTGHRRGNWVNSVAYSPDGRRIVSGSSDNAIKIWDAESGQEIRTLKGHTDGVRTVAYSPDGRYIVSGSGSWDATIKVWDAESGQEIRTLKGHGSHISVYSVAYSPNGRRIASGAWEAIKIWDAESGQEIKTFKEHDSVNVNSVAWSPDGRRIVSGSDNGTITIWDAGE